MKSHRNDAALGANEQQRSRWENLMNGDEKTRYLSNLYMLLFRDGQIDSQEERLVDIHLERNTSQS
ncbi:MAG: hypothetical protein O2820_21930 [Planctomycetota bacterium]|nr:hypothetical protein [Planctomycetota bacterium]MDA1251879.1 hypothetical protein [Planctomycetota bacterium]